MMNKKGFAFNDVPGIAITFLLTGLFFAVGIVILANFQTNIVSSETITAESFTMPNANETITLAHYRLTSITSVGNGTVNLGAANYSITDATGSVVKFLFNNTDTCPSTSTCLITYVYSTYDTASPVAIQNSIEALTEIPANWLLLIAVNVAASVIIGIVLSQLGGRERL